MNATFTKSEESSDGIADVDMPVAKLAYSDSNSDDAGDSGSLPEESASLGKQAKKSGGDKKAKKTTTKEPAQKKMSYIEMIVEAITDIGDKKGASVPAIKTKIREKHDVNEVAMKSQFKKSILKGIDNNTLIRPPSSQENKGVTGRFRVHPDYLKAAQKSEKMKEKKEKMKEKREKLKKKKEELSKPVKKKASAKVDTKDLKSLKEKSLAVKRAKEKIKQARRSIGLTPKAQPKVAPKKRSKPPQKKTAASAAKAKEKPTTSKSAKNKGTSGNTKQPVAKKGKAASTKKKTFKPK